MMTRGTPILGNLQMTMQLTDLGMGSDIVPGMTKVFSSKNPGVWPRPTWWFPELGVPPVIHFSGIE